ncbi:Na+/H+ antiporter NhaC family protein [Allobacillus sp. GCM10007491]|uniref:Na+/H+ antiporter NhaC family protein n=1 Tax=Allobacillus saliphilus TaxID=2912308 RepID=A0A941CWR4_9BACI|nr:Na+/H+ antiporter NhaC family protein [Allobacillus saliphilus]MBR7553560.1 Na+/H+ antiporter NhaC family protein [Allobacillus saliphilus]
MEGTIFSLIPPILMIILVLLTRKVLLSLGAGIIVGALMIESFDVLETIKRIWFTFQELFYAEGSWDLWSIQLIIFLLFLGMLIAFLTASGGAKAFGDWAIHKIRTREGSQYMTGLLGMGIFIDDYFNSLTIGQVSRPVTDRHRVSRAKLAYLIDSTSAPVTVLSPISSWGAYIIGIIATIISTNELTNYQAFNSFIQMVPYNFYAISAILLVFLVAWLNLDIGPMKKHEDRAKETGQLVDPDNDDIPGDLQSEIYENTLGKVSHLMIPIVVLIVVTLSMMIYTGIQASGETNLISIFADTDVNLSLVVGGFVALLVSIIFYFTQNGEKTSFARVSIEGIKAMLPAIYILVLAWMIVSIIGAIGTDAYLSGLVERSNIDVAYLPFLLFIVSGFMAFSTGTSWGTFGIMLPIAGSMAVTLDPGLFIPALAAVLAGSVFGDHCSPISDTSVLSSTGAGANHIDHVLTQIPYAILAAIASSIGYLLFAWTDSLLLSLIVTIAALVLLAYLAKQLLMKKDTA